MDIQFLSAKSFYEGLLKTCKWGEDGPCIHGALFAVLFCFLELFSRPVDCRTARRSSASFARPFLQGSVRRLTSLPVWPAAPQTALAANHKARYCPLPRIWKNVPSGRDLRGHVSKALILKMSRRRLREL